MGADTDGCFEQQEKLRVLGRTSVRIYALQETAESCAIGLFCASFPISALGEHLEKRGIVVANKFISQGVFCLDLKAVLKASICSILLGRYKLCSSINPHFLSHAFCHVLGKKFETCFCGFAEPSSGGSVLGCTTDNLGVITSFPLVAVPWCERIQAKD